jgi:hypothetical protein
MEPLFSGCGVRLVGSRANRLYVIRGAVVGGAFSNRARGLGGFGEGFCFPFSFRSRFTSLDVGGRNEFWGDHHNEAGVLGSLGALTCGFPLFWHLLFCTLGYCVGFGGSLVAVLTCL